MEHLEVNGTTLAFRQAGSGALALFLHGFALDSRMWHHQLDALADTRWCVAVDLRGHGRSAPAADPVLSPRLLAEDVAVLIEALGGGQADLVGFSMGGYVALALIETHPELVRSLVMVDSKAAGDDEEQRAGRDQAIEGILARGRAWFASDVLPKLVAEDADPMTVAAVRTMVEDTRYETLVADLVGMRDRPDRTGALAGVRRPGLVLVGEHDALTTPSDARWIAEHMGEASLVIVEGAAHMSPMERPDVVNAAVDGLWTAHDL